MAPPSAASPKGAPRASVTSKKATMRNPLAVTPTTCRVDDQRWPEPLVMNGGLPEGEALACAPSRVLLDGVAC